jgi:hypothetical protein
MKILSKKAKWTVGTFFQVKLVFKFWNVSRYNLECFTIQPDSNQSVTILSKKDVSKTQKDDKFLIKRCFKFGFPLRPTDRRYVS